MSETKRRPKQEESGGDSFENRDSHKQTRVTLAKDVSSRYRKIMPESKTGSPARRGPAPGRSKKADGFEAPSRARRESGEAAGGPPRRRPGLPGKHDESRPPARRSSFGTSEDKPRSGFGRELELKAIIHRELPEAARQVRETQDLLTTSAQELLGISEKLCEAHEGIKNRLNGLAVSQPELSPALKELETDCDQARALALSLFEKMSFQDLAGQRLLKVESFCQTLNQILPALAKPAGRSGSPRPSSAFSPRSPRSLKEKDQESHGRKGPARGAAGGRGGTGAAGRGGPSRLKGPQGAGRGLKQKDVDKIFGGEDG